MIVLPPQETMIPKRLKISDTIGVVSPSGPVLEKYLHQFTAGVHFFENMGFKIRIGKNALSNSLKYSATAEERADDINSMFTDKEVNAIICSMGGSNCNAVLPLINFEMIKKNPKIFIGISDITILLNAIYHKTGITTFHGSDLMRRFPEYDKQEFTERLVDGKIGDINKTSEWTCIRKGISEGILIGGNLSCMLKLIATPEYCPDFEDKILFLEDFNKTASPAEVDSYLHTLKQQKVFEKIKGLWLGHYNHESGIPYEEIVMNVVKDYSFPILKCDDFGHNTPNTTIPIGIKVRLDATNKQITLLEKCVE